jgi:hypothetical protein
MDKQRWQQLSPERKQAYLNEQRELIAKCKALLERFDKLTVRWLENAKAQASKK